jgi:succinate dehydrogenase/fumarate reductase flavoprotein subunit
MTQGLPKGSRAEKSGVVVIGSGLAGLAAALQARGAGARVVVLEKMDEGRSGGNTRFAGGTLAVPCGSTPNDRAGYVEDFIAKAGGRCNREVIETLAANALDDLSWLGTHGARIDPPTPIAPYRVNAAHIAPAQFVGMPAFLDALRASLGRIGGVIVYETKARQLLLNDRGWVCGVRAVDRYGVIDYLAESVVLATGGYTANRELLESFVDPAASAMAVRGVGWATGDGLVMAREIGAGLTHMGGLTALHVAAVIPDNPRNGIPDHAVPYCLSINLEGKRFHDESTGYVANGKALMRQPAQRAALVFDDEIKQQPRVSKSFATFRRMGFPVLEADSLPGLASQMGLPSGQFVRTIEEFNDAVAGDRAPSASPPKAALAYPIRKPPFYAFFPLVPGITSSFGGPMIDAEAQVLEADGRVLPGLFAAGEVTGGLFFNDYIGGSALANCLVMGRRAGDRAAARSAANAASSIHKHDPIEVHDA